MRHTFIAIIIVVLVSVILGAVFIIMKMNGGFKITPRASDKRGETILISKDGGENWEKAKIPKTLSVKEIFLSKKKPGFVYILTVRNGVWVKEDSGDNFKELPSLLIKKSSLLYAISEDARRNMYVSIYHDRRGRVVKYNLDDKKEEEIFRTPLEGYGVFGVWPSHDGKVIRLIASDGGFYESDDYGYSWSAVKRFKEGLVQMALDNVDEIMWLVNSKGRVLKTSNKGASFIDLSEELKKFDKADEVENIVFDEKTGNLYLATGYGLLRAPYGKGWKPVELLLPPEALPITAVAASQKNSNIIYAGSKNQFYKTDDGGASWRTITLPVKRTISRIAIDLIDSDVIYIGLK